jgi:ABC-2 type transport system permease protein
MRAPVLTMPMLLTFRNSLTAGAVLRRLPFAALGLAFWFGLYFGTYRLLAIIRGIEFLGDTFSEKLFSMTFFSLAGFLVLSNVITSISSFYLAGDVPFLLSKPLAIRHIIRFKTFETGLQSSWMAVTFLTPIFVAFGSSYDASPLYYLLAAAALFLFLSLTAGAGILAAHLLAGIFPAKRSRDATIGVLTTLFLVLYFVIKSSLPPDLSAPDAVIRSFTRFASDSPFLPDYWITKTVFPLLQGGKPDLFYGLVLLSNAGFFLLLSSALGKALYRRNLEKIAPSEKTFGKGLTVYPTPGSSFLYKDGITFFRDTGQWSQIFVVLALVAVYLYNFTSIPFDAIAGLSPFAREIMVAINLLMSGLVLSAVAARFLYTAVSLEGRAFWIVRTSPVDLKRFLWLKFFSGCAPVASLILALVILTNISMHVHGPLMLFSAGTALLLSVTVCGLATGLGAVYPKFRYEHIASVSVSIGAMVFMVVAFGVVVATVSIESWIYYLYAVKLHNPTGVFQLCLAVTALASIHSAAFYLPMKIGASRLGGDADALGL